jgi:hypothetical protein
MSAQAERVAVRRGEASSQASSDETRLPRQEPEGAGRGLLAQVLARENMQRAWKRVKANKGAAGVDGMDIAETGRYLVTALPTIRNQLMAGTYRPSPVRRVGIPKPDGSERELGIPTVTDRLIQQALLQVLQPLIDPTFSEHSHGFRPGRRARDAVLAVQQYVQDGYLLKLGAKPNIAQSVAALSRRWWHNSMTALHHVLTIAYFDRLGMPRLG